MQNLKYKIPDAKYKHGFTALELLITLAIMSILLAAVAFAFNASIINYRENEDIFKAVNSARQALFRITTQLRTANAVDPNSPNNECALITADGKDIIYQYSAAENKLYLVDNSTGNSYLLCDNVAAMTFTKNTAVESSVVYVKSVQISITIAIGDMQRAASAAAVIRRNLK